MQDSISQKNSKDQDLNGNPLGRLGDLIVRIATDRQEIEAAQALRHSVFRAEGIVEQGQPGRDEDDFDRYCDHLIVEDTLAICPHRGASHAKIVATYRLLPQDIAEGEAGFYSQAEFDVADLTQRHKQKRFLEFGRSCVLPQYRSKRTIELLWHGSWAYVRRNGFDVMFGCASFKGTNPSDCAAAMAFLRRHAGPIENWHVCPTGEVAQMPLVELSKKSEKQALRTLPPLIKGYLRLGAMFSADAVYDHEFNTMDILVMLPLERLNPRYVNYYGADAERHTA